jgi:Poly(3-hydroxyalkanoate) synthetase
MNAAAFEQDITRCGDHSPRALRDLTGAHAFVGSRWGEALVSGGELLRVLGAHPLALARAQASLSLEMTRIALGRSKLRPGPEDRRFTDPAWRDNPIFSRLLQGYLAWSSTLLELVHGLRVGADQRRRLLFVAEHLVAAGAPSNLFLTHPGFYSAATRTHGLSIVSGVRHLLEDVRTNRGLPRQVDDSAFRIGHNLATTEGAVVHRDEVFELIQYSPRTESVDAQPVLACPPQINKYYVLDLSPQNSFVRYALERGQQMFVISWRNPTAAQRDWDLATYVRATAQAIDIVREITGEQPVKLLGACAGGLTAAVTLAWLAGRGEQSKVSCLSLFVTMLDSPRARRLARVADDAAVAAALARSQFSGVLDGADMARTFAWLRPNELIWHFVVNNYARQSAAGLRHTLLEQRFHAPARSPARRSVVDLSQHASAQRPRLHHRRCGYRYRRHRSRCFRGRRRARSHHPLAGLLPLDANVWLEYAFCTRLRRARAIAAVPAARRAQ